MLLVVWPPFATAFDLMAVSTGDQALQAADCWVGRRCETNASFHPVGGAVLLGLLGFRSESVNAAVPWLPEGDLLPCAAPEAVTSSHSGRPRSGVVTAPTKTKGQAEAFPI